MLPKILSLSRARRILHSAYPFSIWTKASDMRVGLVQCWKPYRTQSVGFMKEQEGERERRMWGSWEWLKFFEMPVFLVLARQSVKGIGGGTYVEEKGHVTRSPEG